MELRMWMTALGAATVMSIVGTGCATEAGDEETDASEDAVNATAKSECRGNGNMRQGPYPTAALTTGINASTPIEVFCKVTGTAPQPGWSTTWVGATLKGRGRNNLSYVHESVVNGGCTTGSLAQVLASLEDCSRIAAVPRDPNAGGHASSSGSAPPASAPEVAPLYPPAGTQTFSLPRVAGPTFDASFAVHRRGPGTITVGVIYNSYDANGKRIDTGKCPPGTYTGTSEGPYSCAGHRSNAAAIDVTYWATGPIDFGRR